MITCESEEENDMSQIEKKSFDQENITSVREMLKRNYQDNNHYDRAFTMLQDNSPCEVVVSPESEEICAEALLKL